jgi:hypothetical protein
MTLRTWLCIAAFAVICLIVGIAILTAGFLLFPQHPTEGHFEMELPGGGTYRANGSDIDPDAIGEPTESAVAVVVRTKPGEESAPISAMTLKTPQGQTNIAVKSWRADLVKELRKVRPGLDANPSVRIEADRRLKWASIVEIMEACKEAGFSNVGFAPPPDE